jgi:hypothetical protein
MERVPAVHLAVVLLAFCCLIHASSSAETPLPPGNLLGSSPPYLLRGILFFQKFIVKHNEI